MTYRLISKYRDYYDSMFHVYGFDPKKVWVRHHDSKSHTVTSKSGDPLHDKIRELASSASIGKSDSLYGGVTVGKYIGVAGRLYRVERKLPNRTSYEEQYKTGGHFLYYGHNHNSIKFDDYFDTSSYRNRYSFTNEERLQERITNPFEFDCDEPFQLVESPVIMVDIGWHDIEITSNPSLQYYNFSVVKDAFEVFTAIEQYMESVLLAPNDPPQTSNDDRIVSAGFDMKQSFRHRK